MVSPTFPAARSLAEVLEAAEAHGLDELLDARCERLFGYADARVTGALRVLESRTGARTVRDLLKGAGRVDLGALEADAARELGARFRAELERRQALEARPADPAALRAWAEAHGVLEWLDRPVRAVERGLADVLGREVTWSTGRVNVPAIPAMQRPALLARTLESALTASDGLPAVVLRAVRSEIWSLLDTEVREIAQALEEEKRGKKRPKRVPKEPELRALIAAVEGARDRVRQVATPRDVRWLGFNIRVSSDSPPVATYHSPYEHVGPSGERTRPVVKIALRSKTPEGIDAECSCERGSTGCSHALSGLDALAEVLRATRPDEAEQSRAIASRVGADPAEAGLKALQRAITSDEDGPPEPGQLSWSVGVHAKSARLYELVPHVARRGKRGLLAPKTFAINQLASFTVSEAADRALLELLAPPVVAAGRGLARADRETAPIVARLGLAHLAGHPRVYAGAKLETRVDVTAGRLELRGEPSDGGGLRLTPAIDGAPVDLAWLASALAEPTELLAELDVARASLRLTAITPAQRRVIRALAEHGSSFASGQRLELVRLLPVLERTVSVALGEAARGIAVEADGRPLVRLEPLGEAGLKVEIRVRPAPGSAALVPGEGREDAVGVKGDAVVSARRDREAELVAAQALALALGLEGEPRDAPFTWTLPSLERALALVAALGEAGADAFAVEWARGAPWHVARAGAAKLSLRIEQRRDWFGLTGGMELGDARVELAVLLDAARRGQRFVAIGEGAWVELEEELRGALDRVGDAVHPRRGALVIPPVAAPEVEALVAFTRDAERAESWRSLTARIASARALIPELPAGFRAVLRDYQLDGFRWLARLSAWGAGAVLADDMGLGKTVQALAVLGHRAALGPALVIAPTSVCTGWVRECERFAPELRPRLYRDREQADRAALIADLGPGDVLIASYGLVTRDAALLAGRRFATLVADEAQALKNSDTLRARAVRDLDAEWRVALSGTPIENHLGELWSLLAVVEPGLLGSWDEFRERFAGPIQRDGDPARRRALARLIRPLILRRTKAEVAPELPPRTEIRRDVELSEAERRVYEDARVAAIGRMSRRASDLGLGPEHRFEVLAEITRLRQLACHPRLLDETSAIPSAKLETFLALAAELRAEGHRALVFSQFVRHLALVREALDAAGVPYLYLDGATPPEQRDARVAAFQAGEAALFLISLKAGGTGLNLTAADFVIHLDPWWNPAVEDQATDRAHRIGQTRPVTIYRLVASGTIEESILALHAQKRELVSDLLSGTGAASTLTTDQLLALLGAG